MTIRAASGLKAPVYVREHMSWQDIHSVHFSLARASLCLCIAAPFMDGFHRLEHKTVGGYPGLFGYVLAARQQVGHSQIRHLNQFAVLDLIHDRRVRTDQLGFAVTQIAIV